VRILRQHIHLLGYQNRFAIYDEQDQQRLIKEIMKGQEIDPRIFHPNRIRAEINRAKNDGISEEDYIPQQFDVFQKRVALVYREYQETLRRNNALDFGDLLRLTILLLRRFPEVLKTYQRLIQYILVDEFQDTNAIQYELIKLLVEKHRNICVVGDDDQSIYRWRGANITNILNFEKDFAGSRVVKLEQNYRSTKTILRAASSVVNHNSDRKEKTLWTENPTGQPIVIYHAQDEQDEARYVVDQILKAVSGSYRDFAILYRTNAQSRALEEALIKKGIPYLIVGALQFYERREIKDVLAYLRLIANPSDSVSLKRIINTPARGIGNRTLEQLEKLSMERNLPLYEGLKVLVQEGELPGAMGGRLRTFLQMIEDFRNSDLPVPDLTLEVLEKTGYFAHLRAEGTEEASSRIENVEELITVIREYQESPPLHDKSLEGFLDRVALVSDVDNYHDRWNRVSLMTLHCAKGLEFPLIFLTGLEEGLFPHHRRGEDREEMEEERRLCYVGMTRAKKRLYLLHARQRSIFGARRVCVPSRFLEEIPEELVAKELSPSLDRPQFEDKSVQDFSETTYETSLDEIDEIPPIRVGQRVRHPRFGEGTIQYCEGKENKQRIIVYFPTVGAKTLSLQFARLEFIQEP
ncbi:MAG: UvrD-helicase domain-containing protein, partial [Proteobacteria bacterium]|nr:UvrD-helicase domain-containing protein [Pseudomonadota bacterium]NIS68635.1 UvrD-helicase domain-containing protein [Pseudomonadota bacterium]